VDCPWETSILTFTAVKRGLDEEGSLSGYSLLRYAEADLASGQELSNEQSHFVPVDFF
jgi:hypothetical protein